MLSIIREWITMKQLKIRKVLEPCSVWTVSHLNDLKTQRERNTAMKTKNILPSVVTLLLLAGNAFAQSESSQKPLRKASIDAKAMADTQDRPNIVVIFTDDQGYADLGCFGGKHVRTPRIDRMAAEGARLTSFYVAAPLCSPSRAALMTGCYPARINMTLGGKKLGTRTAGVLLSADPKGLNPDEVTIAEVLKKVGYKTGIFGKWHLGDQPDFLPTRQGFDEFFGLPYSHDINPVKGRGGMFPPLPLLEGDKVIGLDPSPDQLTRMFTHRAIDFIKRHKEEPFFLYVPHPMPHGPLHVSPEFMKEAPEQLKKEAERKANTSKRPDVNSKHLYALTIAEIDWSVGQILDTLKAEGLDENTIVVFTTDNGPWCTSAAPLRGKKNDAEEGGMRVPAVIRWPGKIPAGSVNHELMSTMDLLPTFARLAGAELPSDRVIDGKDIWSVLTKGEKTPHNAYFYHEREVLKAVRFGDWKLFVTDGKPSELYNLRDDIGEGNNQLKEYPEVAQRLHALIKTFQADLAQNSRPAAFFEHPKPLTMSTE